MAPDEKNCVSNISYPYSKRSANAAKVPAPPSVNPYQTKFNEYVLEEKDTVSLLEAPPIGRKPYGIRRYIYIYLSIVKSAQRDLNIS